MLSRTVLSLGLLSVFVFGQPFETAGKSVGQRWHRVAEPARNQPIELHISLHSPDRHLIEQHLLEISNPESPRWRQHLGSEDVRRVLKPDDDSVAAVTAWLESAGASGRQSHHAMIVKTTVERAESLLNATFSVYRNAAGRKIVRTQEYYIPQELQDHVEMVAPTVQFPSDNIWSELKHRRRAQSSSVVKREASVLPSNGTLEAACGPHSNLPFEDNTSNITAGPDCVKALYSIDWTASNPNTSFAIFDPDPNPVNDTDLQTFQAGFGNNASNASVVQIFRPGWEFMAANSTDTEATLDVQSSSGLTFPVIPYLLRTDTFGWDGRFGYLPQDDPAWAEGEDYFLSFLHEMAYNDTVPPVVSISAGGNEDYVDYHFAQRACALIAASSARGVTWIVSSGDTGPANPTFKHNITIDPQWPATCPWVLAVGATTDPFNETAATSTTTSFFTGGGFSNYFARPSYQDAVVPSYINNTVTPAFAAQSGFNASGRGYPDVAAIGTNVPVVVNGEWMKLTGTSASSPLWAGMIVLLNDYEASRGNPTLGFVNPWLYGLQSGLRDIVECNGTYLGFAHGAYNPQPRHGYNGSVGWDACTGLGVPVFDVLRASL